MKRIILAAAIICTNAHAADAILIDTYTRHTSECQQAYSVSCEPWKQPRRVSWQHDLSESWSTDIGTGTNSYGAKSANVGAMWQPLRYGAIKAGLWASIVTGYDCNQLRTCIVAGGVVSSVVVGRVVIQALYVPAIGDGTVGVWNLRTGYQF